MDIVKMPNMTTFIQAFERCCRLCAREQDVTIMIFSKEAEAMLLQNKLNRYLLIEVDEDDKLPKNICIQCCSKLQIVCEFIDTARKAQDVLHNQSLILEQNESENFHDTINIKEEYDADSLVTSMEVNVDPAMVLENCDYSPLEDMEEFAGIQEEEIKDYAGTQEVEIEEYVHSQEEEITYLHGADGENVTIKLIKKGSSCDTIGNRKPFQCPKCNRGFSNDLALQSHMWTHDNEDPLPKPFKCISCRECFDDNKKLLDHLKNHTTSGMCKLCGRVFRSEKNLALHMAVHNSLTAKSYVCKVCGRSYDSKSNLKTHSVTHSNERPYTCHYCKKCFKRNQDLKFHINQHTGAKPYKCPFCEKCFASSGNCYSHRTRMHPDSKVEINKRHTAFPRKNKLLRTYTTPKGTARFQCTLCEHSFQSKDNYTYHMYQHTGVKPFHCTYCSEKFVTRNGISLHYSKAHPGKDRPLTLLSKNVLLK